MYTIGNMLDTLIHKWLKIPYTLYVRIQKKPKRTRATVLFIHGIGNSGAAWSDVIAKLPSDIRVITIDLLGFGKSPSPKWAIYSAKTQANSVLATYFKLRLTGPVVIVGHSLGSLVAVEIAKRYPLLVKSLILCSPPFYKPYDENGMRLPNADEVLRNFYRSAQKYPEQFVKLSAIAMKYKLVNRAFNVTEDNVDSYMAALEATIINQTSLQDAQKLRVPTLLIRGSLDPAVIGRNLREIAQANENVTLRTIVASHEVAGLFVPAVVRAVADASVPKSEKVKKK